MLIDKGGGGLLDGKGYGEELVENNLFFFVIFFFGVMFLVLWGVMNSLILMDFYFVFGICDDYYWFV